VDKLTFTECSSRRILQQHDRNEFHRPKGITVGTLFRGDYQDINGEGMARIPLLEKIFEEYSYFKSSTSYLFDTILAQFNLVHSPGISAHICCCLATSTLLLCK
jgi:hypothetical protein